jgi:hypothetical protein
MERSPPWEADQSLQLVKKFPAFLWDPKVLYRTHKCLPPLPILSLLHPVPTTPSNVLKIHINIILPSTSGSPHWPLSLWFPHQHPVHPSLLPHTRYMPHPSHSRFNHPHNIGQGIQIIQLWKLLSFITFAFSFRCALFLTCYIQARCVSCLPRKTY